MSGSLPGGGSMHPFQLPFAARRRTGVGAAVSVEGVRMGIASAEVRLVMVKWVPASVQLNWSTVFVWT